MKIVYIYPEKLPDKKARSVSVINTACSLSKYIDTSLLYEKSNKNILEFYNLECKLNLIPISRKFIIRSNKIFNFNLKKYIKQFDYFYVRHLKTAEFLIKNNVNVIFECHEIFSVKNPKVENIEKFVCENSKGLVFVNKYLQKAFEKKFNILNIPQKVIYNGCGFKVDYIKKDFSNIKEIFYIGSFQKWKGLEFLVENMKYFPNIILNIVGDGNKIELNQIINKYNLKNINFLGFKTSEEIEKLLKKAKLTIIPNIPTTDSKFSMPIKLFEYLTYSNIVLTSNFDTIKEIIIDNKNGFLFEAGNSESFVNKLKYILSLDNNILQNIAKNGYETSKQFTWDNRAKQIIEFIKEIK